MIKCDDIEVKYSAWKYHITHKCYLSSYFSLWQYLSKLKKFVHTPESQISSILIGSLNFLLDHSNHSTSHPTIGFIVVFSRIFTKHIINRDTQRCSCTKCNSRSASLKWKIALDVVNNSFNKPSVGLSWFRHHAGLLMQFKKNPRGVDRYRETLGLSWG